MVDELGGGELKVDSTTNLWIDWIRASRGFPATPALHIPVV